MSSPRIREVFKRLEQANPAPETELIFNSPFELLVAVVLSAQATDISVNKATQSFFALANTPEAMVSLGIEGITPHIQSIGLYRSKAKYIYGLSTQLIANHHSEVPNTREDLMALPGVGRKTANVILNTLFKQPTIAVDTHIFRVANRMQIAKGKHVDIVEKGLEKAIPKAYLLHAHHWLLLHGRYTCTARKPACWQCMLSDLCPYKDKTAHPI